MENSGYQFFKASDVRVIDIFQNYTFKILLLIIYVLIHDNWILDILNQSKPTKRKLYLKKIRLM